MSTVALAVRSRFHFVPILGFIELEIKQLIENRQFKKIQRIFKISNFISSDELNPLRRRILSSDYVLSAVETNHFSLRYVSVGHCRRRRYHRNKFSRFRDVKASFRRETTPYNSVFRALCGVLHRLFCCNRTVRCPRRRFGRARWVQRTLPIASTDNARSLICRVFNRAQV